MNRFKGVLHHHRWSFSGVAIWAIIVVAVNQLVSNGVVVGNYSPSAPTGLYITSLPRTATYVSFCLRDDHIDIATTGEFCHAGNPHGTRVLKRIVMRHSHNRLIVAGDTPQALDSRVLGDITPLMIRGWWRPLLTF
ncbi:MAG: hypothetical protein OXC62_15275 [Aestuariivita sp.]|nr:hypothetical protein [Aestuariivita sp.]